MTLSAAYLDTSAFLCLFLEQSTEEVIKSIWESLDSVPIIYGSRLVLTEARVSLSRLHRNGDLANEHYTSASENVRDFWIQNIEQVILEESIHETAEYLAQRYSLRSSDALHLGTAHAMRKQLHKTASMGFVALDQELLRAAVALDFKPLPFKPKM